MQSFMVSFNVVAPLFILMLTGMLIKKMKLINEKTIQQMNSVSFRVFLPVMLLNNILACDIHQDFDASTMLWGTCISLFLTLAAFVFSILFEKDRKKAAALTQCMFRNNFMLFSLPLITFVYNKTFSSYVSMLPAIVIPLNNVLGVILMIFMVGYHQSFAKTVKSIVLNPFIVASVIGFGCLLLNIRLPGIILKSISNIGSIATPLLFILLGAGLTLKSHNGNLRDILACLAFKMFIFPALFVFVIGYLAGIRGEKLLALFVIVITPAAVPAQVTTSEMGGDGELAGQLIVSGTAFSLVSIFLWLSLLGAFGWL